MKQLPKVGIYDSNTLRKKLISKIIRDNFQGVIEIVCKKTELFNSKGKLLNDPHFSSPLQIES